jgi:hypothetical protein
MSLPTIDPISRDDQDRFALRSQDKDRDGAASRSLSG